MGSTSDIRYFGAFALLFHDVIEDTNFDNLTIIPPESLELVSKMTVPESGAKRGFEWERQNWKSWPDEIKLLKLYDKTHNYMDGAWMEPRKAKSYREFIAILCKHVDNRFPNLNVTKIALALIQTRFRRKWAII
jgi:hypothetical protein